MTINTVQQSGFIFQAAFQPPQTSSLVNNDRDKKVAVSMLKMAGGTVTLDDRVNKDRCWRLWVKLWG